MNMQLAMYQMLSNFASNASPPSPLRIRPLTDQHPAPIVNHPKPLKRLGHSHKRPRLVKSTPTSESLVSFIEIISQVFLFHDQKKEKHQ